MVSTSFAADVRTYSPTVAIPPVLGVLALAVIPRFLGVEGFGKYSLGFAAASLSVAVGGEWLGQATLRLYPDPEVPREGLSVAIGLLVVLSGMAVAATCALLLLGLERAVLVSSLTLAMLALLWRPLSAILRVVGLTKYYARAVVLGNLVGVGFATLAAIVAESPSGAIFGYSLGFVFQIMFGMRWLRSVPRVTETHHQGSASLVMETAGRYAAYGLPLVAMAAGSQALSVADRFILGHLQGDAAVGMYTAAYSVGDRTAGALISVVMAALQPRIVNNWLSGRISDVQAESTKAAQTILIGGLLGCLLAAGAGRALLTVLLGGEYAAAGRALPWVVGGVTAWGLAVTTHQPLEAAKRTRQIAAAVAATAVLNVGLNAVLIPHFSYMGAAWATFASYLAYLVVAWKMSGNAALGARWKLSRFPARGLAPTVLIAVGVYPLARRGGLDMSRAVEVSFLAAAVVLGLFTPWMLRQVWRGSGGSIAGPAQRSDE